MGNRLDFAVPRPRRRPKDLEITERQREQLKREAVRLGELDDEFKAGRFANSVFVRFTQGGRPRAWFDNDAEALLAKLRRQERPKPR